MQNTDSDVAECLNNIFITEPSHRPLVSESVRPLTEQSVYLKSWMVFVNVMVMVMVTVIVITMVMVMVKTKQLLKITKN